MVTQNPTTVLINRKIELVTKTAANPAKHPSTEMTGENIFPPKTPMKILTASRTNPAAHHPLFFIQLTASNKDRSVQADSC